MSNPTNDSKQIEQQELNVVPWKVYEKAMVMNEIREKRKDIIIGILIILLFASNALWLWYWNSYEWVDDYSVDVDAGDGGNANYIGNDGDIYNGTNNSTQETDKDAQEGK